MNRLLNLVAAATLLGGLAALPGCESMTLKVPASASQVALGSGTTAYRAADSGKIYVYDRTWDKIRYAGNVRAGQLVTVDTRNNQILVDNTPVAEQLQLDNNAQYEIYLDRHDNTTPVVREQRTVIEREVHE